MQIEPNVIDDTYLYDHDVILDYAMLYCTITYHVVFTKVLSTTRMDKLTSLLITELC